MIGTTAVAAKIPQPIVDTLVKHLDNTWIFIFLILLFCAIIIAVLLLKGKLLLKLPWGAEVDISGYHNSSKNEKSDKDANINPPPTELFKIQSPHVNCPHIIDFKHVVTKTTYVVSKISEIKYRGCLSEQMGHVDEQFINIRTIYQRLYLEKLREKLEEKGEKLKKEEEYLYEDYKFYQTLIKLMLHDMIAIIRTSFANNHLADYNAQEYQNYVDLKFNVIKGLESDFFDSMYIGDWIISRKDIFDLHRKARTDVRETISNIYINAQKIAINKAKEIEMLEDDLQNFLDETVSGEIKINRTGQ